MDSFTFAQGLPECDVLVFRSWFTDRDVEAD
jgi:hypothetical protein